MIETNSRTMWLKNKEMEQKTRGKFKLADHTEAEVESRFHDTMY